MKFVVYSLGCKVNQYEGQCLAEKLIKFGHEVSTEWDTADVYIINTCSITAEADRKSRQQIAKAEKRNPQALIYICGCSSQYAPEPYADKPNVRLISGTAAKSDFIDRVMSDVARFYDRNSNENSEQGTFCSMPLPSVYEDDLTPQHTRTRAYVKVQDGCNNFCSYCIVPYLRGRSRSRALDAVLHEAECAAKESREIVLTGINVSAYGLDIGTNLTELVSMLGRVDARKRFSSMECTVITPELLAAMRKAGFCDYFHLSLQSGCNSVLKRMNRHYTIEQFKEKAALIRSVFPNAGLTTDIIAGFPEETDEEHHNSLVNVEQIGFSDIHVFPYSRRRGTVADRLRQVDKQVRIARAAEFGALKEKLRSAFFESQYGKEHDVYLETKNGDFAEGYSENYMKVYVFGAEIDTVVRVRVGEKFLQGVKGELL